MKNHLKRKRNVALYAMLCAVIWASAIPVLKISFSEMNIENNVLGQIYFGGLRFFIASLIIFIGVLIKRESIKIKKQDIMPLTVVGVFQTTLAFLFFYVGLSNTTGVKASIVEAAENFIIVILAHMVYSNDKINYNKIIGLLLGFVGIIVVNLGKECGFEFTLLGEGFILLYAISNSVGTIYCKNASKNISPALVTAYQMLIGSLILLFIGGISGEYKSLVYTEKSIYLLIYTVVSSAFAFSLWTALLKYNKAGEITIYRFLVPIAGSIMSIVFLGEEFNIYIIISLILVGLGIVAINLAPRNIERKRKKEVRKIN